MFFTIAHDKSKPQLQMSTMRQEIQQQHGQQVGCPVPHHSSFDWCQQEIHLWENEEHSYEFSNKNRCTVLRITVKKEIVWIVIYLETI